MASPVISKGFNAKAVIVPESAFGTLAASGQLAVPLVSESLTRSVQLLESDIRDGNGAARKASDAGNEVVNGMTRFEADYDNIGDLLKLALGTATGGSLEPLVLTPAEEIELSYSMIIEKGVKRWQYLGGMIEEIRIIGDAAASKTFIETDWIFRQTVQSDTAILAASLTASERIKHSQLTFRIGDISDALAAGDALAITNFTLRVKNNLRADSYASGSNLIIQPIRNTFREVTLELTSPRYDDSAEIAAIMTAAASHTQLQADLTWTGAVGSNALLIQLPELFIDEKPNPNIGGAEALTFSSKFRAYDNIHNTTHMTGITSEIKVTLTT